MIRIRISRSGKVGLMVDSFWFLVFGFWFLAFFFGCVFFGGGRGRGVPFSVFALP